MAGVTPYQRFQSAVGGFDWFMLPFDKHGRCLGPQTRAHLINQAADPAMSDVFVFSHGWNNDWNVATRRYRGFIDGYLDLRRSGGLPLDRELHPLLIGVFWPSTALVFGSERGIEIAADAGPDSAKAVDVQHFGAEISALADEIDDGDVERLYELAERDQFSTQEAQEFARLLAPVLGRDDDEVPVPDAGDETSVVDVWRSLPSPDGSPVGQSTGDDPDAVAARLDDFGVGPETGSLEGAGGLGKLDPRQIVRLVTVRLMKDRAGVVGSHGLGTFLVELLAASAETRPRVHLVGHSYGAKVCLSAICHPPELPRPVDSLLLLQPAVSHRCFAHDDLGTGGYADAPVGRVDLPILSTYSHHDIPLSHFFEYAVRRASDRDEARIAAGEPSRYAALGGVGPHGLGEDARHVPVRLPRSEDSTYDLGREAPGVYGIDATSTIGGHGDIDNASTHWALDNLVAAPRRRAP